MCKRHIRGVRRPFHTAPLLVRWDHPASSDWNADIFLGYPPSESVSNPPSQYQALYDFYHSNKKFQWDKCAEHFQCPKIGKPPYVVRPLRHERGEGFEIASTLPPDTKAATHYWRSLWHRSSEYRVFFVRGEKVLTLLKRVPEGTDQNIPWSRGVSSFVTVHDTDNDRLRHTKFDEAAKSFFSAYPFHFIAIDVLYHDCKHRVVEVNFSPNISIPANLSLLARSLSSPFVRHDRNQTNAAAA